MLNHPELSPLLAGILILVSDASDLALHPQLLVLAPQPRQLVALVCRESLGRPLPGVHLSLPYPRPAAPSP